MADATRTIATDQIIADAELVTTFLRTLIAQEIPLTAAVSIASSYLQTQVLSRISQEKPKEPWDK
jgi:hypothetical protein